MHRVLKFWFPLFCLSILTLAWTAPGLAQYLNCTTYASAPDSLFVQNLAPPYSDVNLAAEVACFVHVLRESDGTGGLSSSTVDSMLGVARQDLLTLRVNIVLSGQSDILNSSYYANPDSFATEIFAVDAQVDAINIYLGPAVGTEWGLAQSIPGTALLLTGASGSYSALSHLLGHCLGLYNTNETVFGVEAPDGSNGATTGDLVADTAADPGLQGWVESDCEFAAAFVDSFPEHAPDLTNIMSQSRVTCLATFTDEQRMRVMSTIQSSAVLAGAATIVTWTYVNKTDKTTILTHGSLPVKPTNAAAFDYDGDGDKDIVVSGLSVVTTTPNRGYAGACDHFTDEGVPYFLDDTSSAFPGNRPPNGTMGLIAADYDNDGAIDFYAPNPEWQEIGSNPGYPHRLYHNTGSAFEDATTAVELNATNSASWDATLSGAWGDFNGDGYLDLLTVVAPTGLSPGDEPASNYLRLYRNEPKTGGGRRFVDVTNTSGLGETDGGVRSVLWIDLDQDHDMDLVTIQYVDNTTDPGKSKYYRNDGGHFSNVSGTALFSGCANALRSGNICAAPGDIDNDGDIDIAYHGQNVRGWIRNDLDEVTGASTLQIAWNEGQYSGLGWPSMPRDLELFDFDLNGFLDMAVPTKNNTDGSHNLLANDPSTHHFTFVSSSGLGSSETFGACAADFHMDGYTDMFLATTILYPRNNTRMFLRVGPALSHTGTNHWVGIRLEDTDNSCNFRGIGATVIVAAGSHRQAQVVDGGSGQAGQHDLDLSFGLGSYSGLVDVEVIWPCGQTQHEQIASDQYHTITLTKPDIINSTVARHLEFGLGENTLNWKFEWDTTTPSNNALDWVEFPSGLPDSDVTHLDAAMGDVEIAAPQKNANGTYHHCVTWLNQECVAPMSAPYKVHSKVIDFDFPSSQKTLKTLVCPRSE